MSTVATTTYATPLNWPSTTLIDRDSTTGYLYAMVRPSTANTFEVWRSTDVGATWGLWLSTVRANVVEIGNIYVHPEGWIYWTYQTNESSQDRIWFRRGILTGTPSWQAELLVASPANGIHGGGMDISVVRTPSAGHYVALAVGLNFGSLNGLQMYGVTISPTTGQPVVNNGIISGNRQFLVTGTGRVTPSADLETGGSGGIFVYNPNIWVSWGRTDLYVAKFAWTGAGWVGPSTGTKLNPVTLSPAQDCTPGRWDGTRFVIAVPDPVATSTVAVYERNKANSATTVRATPTHPTGVVRNCAVGYNSVSGDLRVYAVGTSTTVLYYCDYIRNTATWTAWAAVVATAVLGTTGNNYSIRRGSAGDSKTDVLTAAAGSPNTITYTGQSLSYAPYAPYWDTPAMATNSGSAADVAAARLLDWVFTDPDAGDTQSAYALSRQIGSGTLAYWRASDSTWQAAEVQNTSGTSAVTLASGWAAATDAAYTFKAKVWDAASVASPYSDGYVLIPAAKANPTITAPTASQVITVDTVTATWTVSEQSAYRVVLAVAGGNPVYDTGIVSSAALTYTVPVHLADLSSWTLSLTTYSAKGLASTTQTVNFSVDFVEAPSPTLVATAQPASGVVSVAITNPTAVGSQPSVASQDLYRRPQLYTPLNVNPFFETDLSGWAAFGSTGTRSSTQAHEGSWSCRVVPNGVNVEAYEESSTVVIDQTLTYEVGAWVRADTSNKPIRVFLHWYTSGGAYIISANVSIASPPAGAWCYLSLQAAASSVPTAGRASVAAGVGSTPAASDAVYIDEVKLSVANTDPGVRVAAGLLPGATYADWGPVSGVAYEWRVLVRGGNGTSTWGPWTA